jgi:hypothetical protein
MSHGGTVSPKDSLEAARKREPLQAPWGLFLAPNEGVEGLCWFEDRDRLHHFVTAELWNALVGVEAAADVQAELVDLLEERPALSWNLLEDLNLILEPVGQIHWWGTLAQLHDGEDPFAKDLREAFRESAGAGTQDFSKLSEAERHAFAAFVRSVWEDA